MISIHMLKICGEIHRIYELNDERFPLEWKNANVVSIHEKDDKDDKNFKNYGSV